MLGEENELINWVGNFQHTNSSYSGNEDCWTLLGKQNFNFNNCCKTFPPKKTPFFEPDSYAPILNDVLQDVATGELFDKIDKIDVNLANLWFEHNENSDDNLYFAKGEFSNAGNKPPNKSVLKNFKNGSKNVKNQGFLKDFWPKIQISPSTDLVLGGLFGAQFELDVTRFFYNPTRFFNFLAHFKGFFEFFCHFESD